MFGTIQKWQKNLFVHRLVAEAFVKNKDNKKEVNHKDLNKFNNNFTNLEWCSRLENNNHWASLLVRNSNVLNKEEVKIIKLILKHTKATHIDIAKLFNVHRTVITDIKNNKIWKHVNA